MRFPPKSREEAFKVDLLEKGNYPFSVKSIKDKVSKTGNPMLEVILDVYDTDGKIHTVFDYLSPDYDKFYHFLYSIKQDNIAQQGEIDFEVIKNKNGICKIYISKDKEGKFPDKNAISDYILNESVDFVPDETPF